MLTPCHVILHVFDTKLTITKHCSKHSRQFCTRTPVLVMFIHSGGVIMVFWGIVFVFPQRHQALKAADWAQATGSHGHFPQKQE
jgi:hypothetical protein